MAQVSPQYYRRHCREPVRSKSTRTLVRGPSSRETHPAVCVNPWWLQTPPPPRTEGVSWAVISFLLCALQLQLCVPGTADVGSGSSLAAQVAIAREAEGPRTRLEGGGLAADPVPRGTVHKLPHPARGVFRNCQVLQVSRSAEAICRKI
jgi:hypothetical protein